MNKALIQRVLDILLDIPLDERTLRQCMVVPELYDALRQPDLKPVGWAVLDDTGVIYIHRHLSQAEEWLNRGVLGRSIEPVFLGD